MSDSFRSSADQWAPVNDDNARSGEEMSVICPFCHSADVESIAMFGAQLLTDQYYCLECHTPFEHVRDSHGDDRV